MTKTELNTANKTIDVVGLLKAELLDLGSIFEDAKWKTEKTPVATFLASGDDDTDDGGLTTYGLYVQTATRFGITAYQFTEPVSGEGDAPLLDRDQVVRDAIQYAKENNEG